MLLNLFKYKRVKPFLMPRDLSFDNEISQDQNLNATSRLWIQNNRTLFKQYVIYNELTSKNIENLLKIASYKKLKKIIELSIPLKIYATHGRVEGYLMKYHEMENLAYYMDKRNHSVVLMAFQHLATLINRLPRDVYIGDLHAGNVLANEKEIRVIDVDGFSLKYGNKISCPLEVYANHSIFAHKKYRDRMERFRVSRDSDVACVLWLFLRYLMKVEPFHYGKEELSHYFMFLKKIGLPQEIFEMLRRMMLPKKNYLVPSAFGKIPLSMLDYCSYKDYVNNRCKSQD